MQKTLVSVIIVSYNTSQLTAQSIASVYASQGFKKDQLEVILVDNASTDDSVKFIRKNYPLVKILSNKTNVGFGRANNQGAKLAKGKYLLLLNSDAFLKADSLAKLVADLESTREVACVGPQLIHQDGTIQKSAGFLPTPLLLIRWILGIDVILPNSKMYHIRNLNWFKNKQYPDWLMGACLLFRAKDFLDLGGFDEKMFMYAEEVELFIRLQKSKKGKVLFDPSTQVTHIQKASTNKSKAAALASELKGIKYIYSKHYPSFLWLAQIVIYLGVLLRKIAFTFIPGRQQDLQEYKSI